MSFLFTTDISLAPETVVSEFANRWPVEDTFRNVKPPPQNCYGGPPKSHEGRQFLGPEHPQCWRKRGPERAAAFAYFLYGVIWLWPSPAVAAASAREGWYIRHRHASARLLITPWYRQKTTPSFADARPALRRALWQKRLFQTVPCVAQLKKLAKLLIQALARAA